MIKFSVPLEIPAGGKIFKLNINQYRRNHYQVLNKAKINYEMVLCAEKIKSNTMKSPIAVKITLWNGSERRMDLSNICSIVDKFTMDYLVKIKVIEDDDCKNITNVNYIYGGIDRDNPRCDIEIKELECQD